MKLQKEGKPTGDARVNKVYRIVDDQSMRHAIKIIIQAIW